MSIKLVMLSNHPILYHPFSFCFPSFSASGSFPVSWPFPSGGIGVSASASNQHQISPGLISLKSKGHSRVFSSTVQKHQFLSLSLLMVQHWHPYMTTGKTTALTIQTFVGKVKSLLFNILSRFFITSLPKSKYLNFMAAVTIHSDFGAQENKICHCFQFSPIYLPWSDGTGCHDLIFECWILSQLFHFTSFTFIKRLFSSSLLSAIRVLSSAYLRLLIFLLAILIPACDSFSPAFCMMYSACKLNKQGDTIQPWCTPFLILNSSILAWEIPWIEEPCELQSMEFQRVWHDLATK